MARAATTADAWNAVAEPQRRRILTLLRGGGQPVTEVARALREVRLVRVREEGRRRLYALDARGLRPIHEWVGGFERFWNESFARLDAFVRELAEEERKP